MPAVDMTARRTPRGVRNVRAGTAPSYDQRNMNALVSATGMQFLLDSSHGLTLDGTDQAISWQSRIGGLTLLPLAAASPVLAQPSRGRRGLVFAQTGSLMATVWAGASVFAGASYSSVLVEKVGPPTATRCSWGLGNEVDDSLMYEGISTGTTDSYRRVTDVGGSTSTVGGSAKPAVTYVRTTTYDATTQMYNSWVNGVASMVNGVNTRLAQTFSRIFVGGVWIGASTVTNPSGNTIYCIGGALGVWTAEQRKRVENAATALWIE